MIINDLKAEILKIINGALPIIFNEDLQGNENKIILRSFGDNPTDLGDRDSIQIIVKNFDMDVAESMIKLIYESLYPRDINGKSIMINEKLYHAQPKQTPFYNDMNENGLFSYIFNIKLDKI